MAKTDRFQRKLVIGFTETADRDRGIAETGDRLGRETLIGIPEITQIVTSFLGVF